MKRIYHHVDLLEEAPMWGNCKPTEQDVLISLSYKLLIDRTKFENACNNVIIEWPFSTEHNLSAKVQNRKAWMGQAACCVSHGSTEYTTRQAWRMLTPDQQNIANGVAEKVIKDWELCRK